MKRQDINIAGLQKMLGNVKEEVATLKKEKTKEVEKLKMQMRREKERS